MILKFNNKYNLLKKIKDCSYVIGNKNIIPITDNILMEIDKDSNILSMTATDLEIRITNTITIEEAAEETVKFLINPKDIIPVLELPGMNICSITLDKDNYCIYESFDTTLRISISYEAKEYPIMPFDEKDNNAILFNSDVFKKYGEALEKFCGTDDLRPLMTGVFIDTSESPVQMVSTNAHRMIMIKTSLNLEQAIPSIIIPRKGFHMIRKIANTNETIPMIFNNINAKIITSESTIMIRLIDGKYPTYKAIIPKYRNRCVSFVNSDILHKNIAVSKNVSEICSLGITSQKLHIRSINFDTNQVFKTSLRAASTAEGMISFNPMFLKEILDVIPNEVVYMYFSAANKAVVITRSKKKDPDENILFLLMPIVGTDSYEDIDFADADSIFDTPMLDEEAEVKKEMPAKKEEKAKETQDEEDLTSEPDEEDLEDEPSEMLDENPEEKEISDEELEIKKEEILNEDDTKDKPKRKIEI